MHISKESLHFQILDRLCTMPRAVRGMAAPMLQRLFGSLEAVDELTAAGLIKKRGWADGPGSILVPTSAGEALWDELKEAPHQDMMVTYNDRVLLPQRSS